MGAFSGCSELQLVSESKGQAGVRECTMIQKQFLILPLNQVVALRGSGLIPSQNGLLILNSSKNMLRSVLTSVPKNGL